MDFALNEEQTLLRDSVRRFVDQDYGFEQRRRLVAHEGGFSAKHWAQFAQLGWLGAGLPEAAGGFGGSVIETAIIAEQLGRGLVVEPFVPVAVLAAQALWHAGGALPVLGALVDGACRIVPALNDAVDAPATVHAADNGARRLVGRKTLVVGGPQADRFLVSAAEGNGVSLLLLPVDAPGLVRHDHRLIDGTPACDLQFDTAVQAGMHLGAPGAAAAPIEVAQHHATTAVCAQALGVMDRAIELTREYLLQRQQFGVAIASFQSLRHRLADMLIAQAQARATLHGALAALVDDEVQSREPVRAVAIAKAQSGRSGRFIGAQAIQLHGGIGMADESMVGHCFKQLMVLDAQHGNTAAQLRVLADGLNGDLPRATNST